MIRIQRRPKSANKEAKMVISLKSCLLLVLLTVQRVVATEIHLNTNRDNNSNGGSNSSGKSRRPVATPLVAHRFRSANNITILHEVRDDEPPLVLNTHEVLPIKPPKKKPHTLFEKTLIADYEKPRPLKEYELHPVTFDFNLGDLEDLEHEASLSNGDGLEDDGLDEEPPNVLHAEEGGVSYTEPSGIAEDAVVGEGSPQEEAEEEEEVGKGAHNAAFVGVAVHATAMPTTTTETSSTPSKTSEITATVTISATTPSAGTSPPPSTTTTLPTTTTRSTTSSSAAKPSTNSATTLKSTADVTTISTTTTASATPTNSPASMSPHIFKIVKNKSKIKGRELLKKDSTSAALGFNSISRYFGSAEEGVTWAAQNASAESANMFQLLTNLYDHFYWQPSEIRTEVSTACGIELQAYLTALNGNFEWAQRAYDASGRYRGQAFYGNDKWLGEKAFCYELNGQVRPEERKHFEFQFYVAMISIRTWLPKKIDFILQLGECLPRSCTPQDIQAVLSTDPHAHMLHQLNSSASNSSTTTHINVLRVRKVPGDYSYWMELKFQIFISFVSTLIAVVVVATWYQAKLNRQKCTVLPSVSVISVKVGGSNGKRRAATNNCGEAYNGKAFELYQMSTLNDNNNVDIEAAAAAVNHNASINVNNNSCNNGKNNSSHHHHHQLNYNNNNGSSTNTTATTTTTNNNNNSTNGAKPQEKHSCVGEKRAELERKTELAADYKGETCSSESATAAYEAKQKLRIYQQVLLCFAFQTNANVIMNIDDSRETQTSCVHGLRVFSVLWTIMVHTYLQMFTIGENRFTRIIVERSIWYQIVGNATFSVDTFFFISGFLVTLLYLKQEKTYPEASSRLWRKGFLDTVVILIYRYIRLTPAYLFVIFFNDFFLRQTFDSSVFRTTVAPNTCSLYWWRNIFYINNFYPLSEICMIWSWYMANDMQFYVMASLLLFISTRYFKTALLIVTSFLFSSWAVSGIVSLHYSYTHKVANPFESFDFLYDKPWQRVGTYIMGMIAGYIIHKVKNPPQIKQRTNLVLWAGSLGLIFIIILGVWDGELSVVSTAFYVSIGHTAFGFGLVWIVLSCCWGLAQPVNRVLAYRGLWPLSRLTYCTYLIHPVLMLLISYRMDGTVHLNSLFVLIIFLGNAVVSFGVAFFISVLFEAPVIRLLKIFFRK